MKFLEYIGLWWLPSNPDNKVSGIMKFSDEDGICLELLGTFGTIEKLEDEDSSYEIILGFTREGKLLTLVKSRRFNFTLPSSGIINQKYRVTAAFLGVHFNKSEEIKFFKLSVEYTYLSAWVYSQIPNFLQKWHQEYFKNQDCFDSINANLNSPELEAKTSKERISITPFVNYSSDNFLESKQRKIAQLTIDFLEKELTIDECYLNYLYPLQNLLSLATNNNNFIVNLTVFSRNGNKKTIHLESEKVPIQLISRIISQDKREEKSSIEMLFKLKDIESEFTLYLQKWLNINDELKHICDIYFGIKYAEFMYGEQRFLSIVQALESYHRIQVKNEQISQQEHEKRLKEIYDRVPNQHLDWLKEKLNFSHEPSLKDRIEYLTNLHKKVIDPLIKVIEVSLDCNTLTYNEIDEELVKWLVRDCAPRTSKADRYCQAGAKKRIYPYPVGIISKSDKTTTYQYQDLQIEQKYLPPADWEFITRDSHGKIINRTWWGYEDGSIDIGIYIENFLKRCTVEQ